LRCAARGSRPFNSLSRDHEVVVWVTGPILDVCFQLPLSGSPSGITTTFRRPSGTFQLPLSGSHDTSVQVPCGNRTFNSLSRDHRPKINWRALLRQAILHFQLPLSGSLLVVVTGDVMVTGTFNSLSRDHWQSSAPPPHQSLKSPPLSTPSLGITERVDEARPVLLRHRFQLPLSGSQKFRIIYFISLTECILSTPSLGITYPQPHQLL